MTTQNVQQHQNGSRTGQPLAWFFRSGGVDPLEVRLCGNIDKRLADLSLTLRALNIERSPRELFGTQALVAVTTSLDAIADKGHEWRGAVVNLVLVAELWGDKTVADHVLRWTRAFDLRDQGN